MARVAKVAVDLEANSAKFTSGLSRADAALAASARQWDRHLSSMDAKLAAVGNSVKGLAALAGIGSVGVMMQQASSKAMEFANAMAEVSTVLADKSQVDSLKSAVQELAKEFGSTGVDQAKALYEVISAGASDATVAIEQLTAANKLAKGGVAGVKESADGLTSVMNAYGKSAGSAADVSDAFFVAVRDGKTTVSQLSASIGMAAPIAAQAGVSLEELLASVAALTKGGMSTSMAMAGVRQVISSIIKPASEASKMAKAIGLDFSASALASKGFIGFMQDVRAKTGGSTEAMAQLFGGVESLGPALALTGSQANDFAVSMENMKNKAGETEKAVTIMADSPLEKFKKLQAAADGAMTSIGESINIGAIPAMEKLVELVTTLDKLFGGLKGFDQRSLPQLEFGVETARERLVSLRKELAGMSGGAGEAIGDIFSADAGTLFSGNAIGSRRKAIEDEITRLNDFLVEADRRMVQLRGGKMEPIKDTLALSTLRPEARPAPAPSVPDAEAVKKAEAIAKQIEQLQFQEAQLSRTSREQAIYAALQTHSLAITSQEGQAVAEAAGKLYDKTKAVEAAKLAQEQLNEAEAESWDIALRQTEARDKIIGNMEAEVANNEKLIAALKVSEAEYERVAAMIELVNAYRQAGIEMSPEEAAQAEAIAQKLGEQRAELDGLKAASDEWRRAQSDATRVIGTAFEDAALKGGSLREVLQGLDQDLARIIMRMAVTKPLENALSNSLGGFNFGGMFSGFGNVMGGGTWESSQPVAAQTIGADINSAGLGGFADGGPVNGPGGPRSDSILAALSNGEYVINAHAAGRNRALLDAINNGRPLPRFADGGPVGAAPGLAASVAAADSKRRGGDTYYIDARGADSEGLARLEATVRKLDASIERRAVNASRSAALRPGAASRDLRGG